MTETTSPEIDLAGHFNALASTPTAEELARVLPVYAGLGYRRMVVPPLNPDAIDVPRVRAVFAEHGVSPIVMTGQTPEADVSSPDPDVAAAGAAQLRRAVQLTEDLGADQLNGVVYGLFGPSNAPATREAFERSARAVGAVADEAHERGVMMTFEVLNRYETSMINTAAQALAYVEASGSAHLRIHLDTFHMAIEEQDMVAAIRTALPRLGYLELGQSGRGALSAGAVDLPSVIAATLDAGYAGRWGFEAFARGVLGQPASDVLAIWRDPFDDGEALAADALRVVRSGWAASTAGRRARRESRVAAG